VAASGASWSWWGKIGLSEFVLLRYCHLANSKLRQEGKNRIIAVRHHVELVGYMRMITGASATAIHDLDN
jgi:hypothetical protein